MNAIRKAFLPALKRAWSPNHSKSVQRIVKDSMLVSQIISVPQIISCFYCTESLTTTPKRLDKNLIARQELERYLKDPENLKNYQMIELELEVMRQNGESVPSDLKDRHMLELTLLNSRNKRRKYLEFIYGIEKKKENRKAKTKEAAENLERIAESNNIPAYLRYQLGCNSPFLRFRETTINKLYNWKLLTAMMYGQKIIMDCAFEDTMTRAEIRNCARQLMLSFSANRTHPNPLDITFCNLNKESFLHQELLSFMPTMYDHDFPMNVTDKPYLELFDHSKLVYLTPDSNNVIEKYDYDAIYIVGAIVDKVSGRSHTLAKAKRENLRHAKLPIDKYLRFGCGSKKSLTLNQMVLILADLQQTQDWNFAFRHVPKRKLYEYRLKDMENRIKEFCYENKYSSYGPIYESDTVEFDIKSRKKFRCKK